MPDPDNVLNRGCGKPIGIVLAIIVGIVIALLTLTGCGAGSFPEPQPSEGTKALVIKEPDGVANVYFVCFGTVGIYVTEGARRRRTIES